MLGHRVEPGEIEAVVRKISGLDGVIAVGWPVTPSGCGGTEVFLEGEVKEEVGLRDAVASALPEYMVPSAFVFLEAIPLTANGPSGSVTNAIPTFAWNTVTGIGNYTIWLTDQTTGVITTYTNLPGPSASPTPAPMKAYARPICQ